MIRTLGYGVTFLALAWATVLRAEEPQMRADIDRDIPLAEAVTRANEQLGVVPPLTEDEIIAAVHALKIRHPKIREAAFKIFERITTERVLPRGVYVTRSSGFLTPDAYFDMECIELELRFDHAASDDPMLKGRGSTCGIRERFLSYRSRDPWETIKYPRLEEKDLDAMLRLVEQVGDTKASENAAKDAPAAAPSGAAKEESKQYGPSVAHELVQAALEKAKRESKVVFLKSGFPECGDCRLFDRYHARPTVQAILEKHCLLVALDIHNMPDGRATFANYAQPAAPAWVLISPDGTVLVDSYSPQGSNTGYPQKPQEVAYYLAALKRSAPTLSEAELRTLVLELRIAAGQ